MLQLKAQIQTPAAPKSRRSALPPTRGQVQVAATFFARALGADKNFAKAIFAWGITSVVCAWGVVRYAKLAALAQKVVGIVSGGLRDRDGAAIVDDLENDLRVAREADVAQVKAAREATPPVPEVVASAETRVLKGIPHGDRPPLSPAQRELVVGTLAPVFLPDELSKDKEGNPIPFVGILASEILGRSGRSQGFALWLIEQIAGAEDFAAFMVQLEAIEDESAPEDEVDEDGEEEDGDEATEAA